MRKKIWYVTGASKGLGLALVKKLLSEGYSVAATSRRRQELMDAVGVPESASFLPLEVNLVDDKSVEDSLSQVQTHFGKIDVVVNNAGYGISGSIEELSMEEITQNVNINLLATLRVVHYAMPYLRTQKAGHIINISSIGGLVGPLGWSIYAATKGAVLSYTEVLAQDVKEFGVNATVVAPGRFRTSFLADGDLTVAKHSIEDYKAVHELQEKVKTSSGTQTGDPEKAAQAMIDLTENPEPPVVLFLGADAYDRATQKIIQMQKNLENNKAVTFSTDF